MFNMNEHKRTEFEHHLGEKTGKRIPVEYKFLDKGNKFTDNYVDLQDVIRMEIEIED
jgi:DNA polymerase-3 subunit gamma/tau